MVGVFYFDKILFCYNKFCIEIYDSGMATDVISNFAITNFVLKF